MITPTRFHSLLLALALSTGFLNAATPAPAPTPPRTAAPEAAPGSTPLDQLPLILITATRQPQPWIEAPVSSSIVPREELSERQIATLPDALREVPGVMIQKTSIGQGSPFIRGFTGFRNLFLIDGIRLNNSVFREGPNQYWNTVDPFGLDRIEVIRGEGSVLYGTDAIGGTVQALTRAALPEDAAAGESFLDGRALYRFGSASRSHFGRIETRFGEGEAWGLHLGVTAKTFGDTRAAGLGRLPKTGYDEWDGDAKLTLRLSEPWRLTLAWQGVNQDDAWRTHRTVFARTWEGTSPGTERIHRFDQERQLAYGTLEGTDLTGWLDRIRFTLSWHRQAEDRERVQADQRRDLEGFDVATWGATVDAETPLAWGPLSWGAAFYQDNVNSYRINSVVGLPGASSAIQGPVADDSTYRLFDLYLQQKLTPTDPIDILFGLRFSHAEADAGKAADPITGQRIGIRDSWDTVVGSARFLWRVQDRERLNLFGGVSQGFRAPNLSDLTRFDIARSSELEIPSPGLDPERFLTFELGARSQSGPLTFQGALFYTRIDDLIVRQPTGTVIDGNTAVRKRNASEGYVWGFEAAAEAQIHRDWAVFAQLAWNDGEADAYPTSSTRSAVEPLSRMLPLSGELGIRFERGKFWAELYALGAAEQDRLNSSDRADSQRIPPGGTPGYVTLNVRGGWRATEQLDLQLALENLTDTEYRVHGSGQNEPGFGATVTAALRF